MRNEDLHHFEVGGSSDDGDSSISLTCLRCNDFHVWIEMGIGAKGEVGPTLAELEERAEEHVEAKH